MSIRCLLAALAITAVLCVPVQAQDERHEVAVSYGAVPNTVWIDIYSDLIPASMGMEYDNGHYVGPIGLEYFYHTSPLVGVGAVAVFATNNEDGFYNNVKGLHINRSYLTFMPSVKLNWLRKANWGFYSKLAAGVTYAHLSAENYDDNGKVDDKVTEKDLLFNYQASLIGFEAGSDRVRAFTELGIGEQGVALAGLRVRF